LGSGFIASVLVGKDYKFSSISGDYCKRYNLKRENGKGV